MAQMNRNVNLEEIESDALLGIDALKNQTFLQKIVFFGCVGIGVVLNVSLPLMFGTPTIVCGFSAECLYERCVRAHVRRG